MRRKGITGIFIGVCCVGLTALIGRNLYNRNFPKEAHFPPIPHFTLVDQLGFPQRPFLWTDSKAVAIISFSQNCGIPKEKLDQIAAMQKEFLDSGIKFVVLDSDFVEDREAVDEKFHSYGLNLPILFDSSQLTVHELGLDRSFESVLFVPKSGRILFRGDINDLHSRLKVDLAGAPIDKLAQASSGCLLPVMPKTEVTYEHDIAPLIRQKCQNCHHFGGRDKPYLDDFDSVRNFAAAIRNSVMIQRMPPTAVDSHYVQYIEFPSLTSEEKRNLINWVDEGLRRGKGPDPLQNPREYTNRKPVVDGEPPVYTAQTEAEVTISPQQDRFLKFYQLGGPVPRDLWITDAQIKSKLSSAIARSRLHVVSEPLTSLGSLASQAGLDENRCSDAPLYILGVMGKEQQKGNRNYIGMPMQRRKGNRLIFDQGEKNLAVHIAKGYFLILEAKLRSSPEALTGKIAVDFYGKTSQENFRVLKHFGLTSSNIQIPPNVENYAVQTRQVHVSRPIGLEGLTIHMHEHGRSVQLIATDQAGKKTVLFSTPNFLWSRPNYDGFHPKQPIDIPAGSTMSAECRYENLSGGERLKSDSTIRFGMRMDGAEMCNLRVYYYNRD